MRQSIEEVLQDLKEQFPDFEWHLNEGKKWVQEEFKETKNTHPCLFDGLDPNKPYGIACPCPKHATTC